ncbi:MAG: IMP dehydrogenase [Candidatus Cryptobacteroides sp.]|nr:IMP dehydrogenase [Bacteroidales bacterium]MDD7134585.1 IMP dehydrogenase [Bacteroidales bacterium]MDY2773139.1 IMP dehydrogenase [Candidatus Cryptobacteroides sp.]
MSFAEERINSTALTFDDVLLVPAYSEVLPREVSTKARFTRNISLNIPIVSAAMDTVSEKAMAIMLARKGGISVVHKNMGIEAQARQIREVKEYPAEGDKIPCLDAEGRLRVAAGVGITADVLDRVTALVEAGVDAIVLDSAHGDSHGVVEALRKIKAVYPELDTVVGNIATAEAAVRLIEAGADSLKVGIGPGSICTTRIIAGVGVPQISAIYDVAKAAEGSGVPVIADGGLRYSGDIVKALAAGGDSVMIGSMFAGTDEAPGEIFEENGRKFKSYRGMGSVDAMKAGSRDRYFQDGEDSTKKLVPEGVVARVPYKGSVGDIIYQLVGGIRSGMGYCGAADIDALHTARFVRITANGLVENHPHDITITGNTPNYHK